MVTCRISFKELLTHALRIFLSRIRRKWSGEITLMLIANRGECQQENIMILISYVILGIKRREPESEGAEKGWVRSC